MFDIKTTVKKGKQSASPIFGNLKVGKPKRLNNKWEEARYSNPLLKPISKAGKLSKTIPSFKIKSPMKDKDMNWSQTKWKYPKLKPMGDKDRDGVKNMFDCKPLNRKRQDVDTETKERIRMMKEDWGFTKKEAIEHLRNVEGANV